MSGWRSPLEFTETASVKACQSPEAGWLAGAATNTDGSPIYLQTVGATVQFIREHYDSLFRKLAE